MIMVKRAYKVQKRLATILLSLPERKHTIHEKAASPTPVLQPTIPELVQASAHNQVGNRYRCRDCLCGFTVHDSSFKAWLQSPCIKPEDDRGVPIPLSDVFHIGNNVTHPSHRLFSYRAFIYCGDCGSYAQGWKLVYLAKECNKIPTIAGDRVLQAIKNRALPPGVTQWPDEES